jgi:recombination protein RecA
MSNVVNIKENIVIAISQVMANTSGYGATKIEKGGYGIKYKADVKLMVKSAKDIEIDGRVVGKEVEWEVDATPFNQPPAAKYTSIVRYGVGIDEIQEVINIAIDAGIVEKGGAWYSYDGNKYQGMEKLRLAISESKELQNKLNEAIKECLQ